MLLSLVVPLLSVLNSVSAVRDDQALRVRELTDASVSGKMCSVTEFDGHTKYGVSFAYPIDNIKPCGSVPCNPHIFMSKWVDVIFSTKEIPKYTPKSTRKACICSVGTEELFTFPLWGSDKCDGKECFMRYSDIWRVVKKIQGEDVSPGEYLKSHNHWRAECEPGSTVVPGIADILRKLAKGGKTKEVEDILRTVRLPAPVEDKIVESVEVRVEMVKQQDWSPSISGDSELSEIKKAIEVPSVEVVHVVKGAPLEEAIEAVLAKDIGDDKPSEGIPQQEPTEEVLEPQVTERCVLDFASARHSILGRISAFTTTCGIEEADMIHTAAGTLTLEQRGRERLCASACAGSELLGEDATDLNELSHRCGAKYSIELDQLADLKEVVTVLSNTRALCQVAAVEAETETETEPQTETEPPAERVTEGERAKLVAGVISGGGEVKVVPPEIEDEPVISGEEDVKHPPVVELVPPETDVVAEKEAAVIGGDGAVKNVPAIITGNGSGDVAQKRCPDRSMRAHDCGNVGIDQKQCEGKGCCWDEPRRPHGQNWCYHTQFSFKQLVDIVGGKRECERKCPATYFEKKQRDNCAAFLILSKYTESAYFDPDASVREAKCHEVGCCWQPLEENSREPWCFETPCIA